MRNTCSTIIATGCFMLSDNPLKWTFINVLVMIAIIGSLLNWWRHGIRVFTNILFDQFRQTCWYCKHIHFLEKKTKNKKTSTKPKGLAKAYSKVVYSTTCSRHSNHRAYWYYRHRGRHHNTSITLYVNKLNTKLKMTVTNTMVRIDEAWRATLPELPSSISF